MVAGGLAVEPSSSVLTVAQFTEWVKRRLESDPRLARCAVVGELSNFKHHTSGHMYFTLKDERSRVRGIMFSGRNRSLNFVPKDGMRVICTGAIGVFDRDGQYQLYVDEMQPDGVGALYVAYLQLREKLAAEGLFEDGRKRTLPLYPRCIGVVTSSTGAVIRDICTTLSRRYPLTRVVLSPASVQGAGAGATIVNALDKLRRLHDAGTPIDVVIVGRGGGSLEELWPFNEEPVARAVADYPIPVISAVGHETDFTICDFVADVRAATPTAAAELAAPSVADLRIALSDRVERAKTTLRWTLHAQNSRLQAIEASPLIRDPLVPLDRRKQALDYLEAQLQQRIQRPVQLAQAGVSRQVERLYRIDLKSRIEQARSRIASANQAGRVALATRLNRLNHELDRSIAQLDALNPLKVLSRGYSLLLDPATERVIGSVQALQPGQRIRIRLSDGDAAARIENERERDNGRDEQLRLDL